MSSRLLPSLAMIRSFRSMAPQKVCFSSVTYRVEILSFSAAWSISSRIASRMLIPEWISMKFMLIRLPISSSSKDSSIARSRRDSLSIKSMSMLRSDFVRRFNKAAA